jgi:hypothetical protein
MAEQVDIAVPQVQVTPVVTPVVDNTNQVSLDTQVPTEPSMEDILSKVTAKKEVKTPQDAGGTFKDFDDITDPAIRQKMIDREKQRQADYTRKTQEVAREREEVNQQLKDMQSWDESKIQRYLLNNPSFMQAAQRLSQQPQNPAGSGLTDEQFSALTQTEKNQLFEMNRQIGELRQQNFVSAISQKDSHLQTKYGDYDSIKVNEGIQSLAKINPIDIREHVYKAIYHDDHVRAAYEEGKKYRDNLNQQRTQAVTTTNGVNMMPASDTPKKEKGENDINYFSRLAQRRIDQARSTTAIRK